MKEIRVTDSFLSMSAERRNCQNEERYEDCATEEYLKRVKTVCSCIPENLLEEADDKKVFLSTLSPGLDVLCYQDICSAQGRACVEEISTEPVDCVKPCAGIYASLVKHDVISAGDHSFSSLLDDYNRYKNLFEDYVDFPTEIKGC